MRQVGHLPELYEGARSAKYKIYILVSLPYIILDFIRSSGSGLEDSALKKLYTHLFSTIQVRSEDLDAEERIILKWIFKKQD